MCFNGEKPSHTFDETIWGGQLGYGLDTLIGPIEGVINWNSRSKNAGVVISVGYKF